MIARANLAYVPVYVHPEDALNHTLRFNHRRKNLEGGRLLLIFMPRPLDKNVRGKLIRPTDLELRKAHRLGLHLFEFAISKSRLGRTISPTAAVIEMEKLPNERIKRWMAIPYDFGAEKIDTHTWRAGIFTNYLDKRDSGFVEHETPQPTGFEATTFKNYDDMADWMCDSVGAPRLARTKPSWRQRDFYSLPERQEGLIGVGRALWELQREKERAAARKEKPAPAPDYVHKIPPEARFFRLVAWMTVSPQFRSALKELTHEAAKAANKPVDKLPEVRVRSGLEHPTEPFNYEAEIHGARVATNRFDELIRIAAGRMGITGTTAIDALPASPAPSFTLEPG